mmetsp:Transcript_81360/g.136179  ORF Transcript_81360/g.136179 Transcript_81360/m.136179 type:complete len:272 (+) Transcript_81360:2525-3340(+)
MSFWMFLVVAPMCLFSFWIFSFSPSIFLVRLVVCLSIFCLNLETSSASFWFISSSFWRSACFALSSSSSSCRFCLRLATVFFKDSLFCFTLSFAISRCLISSSMRSRVKNSSSSSRLSTAIWLMSRSPAVDLKTFIFRCRDCSMEEKDLYEKSLKVKSKESNVLLDFSASAMRSPATLILFCLMFKCWSALFTFSMPARSRPPLSPILLLETSKWEIQFFSFFSAWQMAPTPGSLILLSPNSNFCNVVFCAKASPKCFPASALMSFLFNER